MINEQSIKDGTRIRFYLKDIDAAEFAECADCTRELLYALDGKMATVMHLATATELGEQDFEYYTIGFDDGTVLEAVSGYHFQLI